MREEGVQPPSLPGLTLVMAASSYASLSCRSLWARIVTSPSCSFSLGLPVASKPVFRRVSQPWLVSLSLLKPFSMSTAVHPWFPARTLTDEFLKFWQAMTSDSAPKVSLRSSPFSQKGPEGRSREWVENIRMVLLNIIPSHRPPPWPCRGPTHSTTCHASIDFLASQTDLH